MRKLEINMHKFALLFLIIFVSLLAGVQAEEDTEKEDKSVLEFFDGLTQGFLKRKDEKAFLEYECPEPKDNTATLEVVNTLFAAAKAFIGMTSATRS